MNIDILTATALVVASICSACLVMALPAFGLAALRGSRQGMLRVAGCALGLVVLAFIAFTVLGTEAAGDISQA